MCKHISNILKYFSYVYKNFRHCNWTVVPMTSRTTRYTSSSCFTSWSTCFRPYFYFFIPYRVSIEKHSHLSMLNSIDWIAYCFVRRIRTSLNTLPSRSTSQFLVAARTQNASDIARVRSTDDSTLKLDVQEKIKYSVARIHANVFRRQDVCPDRVCIWKTGDAYEYRNAAIWNRCKACLSHTYDACISIFKSRALYLHVERSPETESTTK